MDDGVCRVQFDSTLDEFVDANLRLMNRSPSIRTQRVRTMVAAGGCLSAAMLVTVFVRGSQRDVERSAAAWAMLIVIALALGAGFAYLYGVFLRSATRRQYARVIAEQLGGSGDVRVDIELRREGAWVSQKEIEMTFAWSNASEIVDTGDAIELRFSPGLIVARNRAFRDAAARQRFLERARALSQDLRGN